MKLRWIVISYFFIAGGITIASAVIAAGWVASGTIDLAALGRLAESANRGELRPEDLPQIGRAAGIAAVLAFAAGAALGGFFAGRASPHRSYIEPALAAAAVVGSFVALIYSTPMGAIAVGLIRDRVETMVSILAATGLCAGLIGAVLGELTDVAGRSGQSPATSNGNDVATDRVGVIRQSGVGFLITTGALLAATLFAAVLLINDAAEEALRNVFAWQQSGGGEPLVEIPVGRLIGFAILATTAAAAIGGAVTQLAARSRAVAASGIGAGIAIGAVALSIAPLFPRLEWLPMAAFGGAVVAGLLAAALAALVCAVRRDL